MRRQFLQGAVAVIGAVVAAILLFEAAAWLTWGPPAVHFLTPAARDVQTDYDVTYGLRADRTRNGCPVATATGRPVVFIGDSFVFGQGVADGQDFVARLGCRFREQATLNLGSIGQDFLYYELAARTLLPADAEAVVVVLYENDLPPTDWNDTIWAVKRWLYRWSHTVIMLRRLKQQLDRTTSAVNEASLKIDGKLNNPKAVISTDPGVFERLADPSAERLARLDDAIGALLDTARQAAPKARLYLAMAPEASTLSAPHRNFYRSLKPDLPLPPAGAPSAIYRRAQASCNAWPGCRFIDLYPRLAPTGSALYFPHDFHWNEAGHAAVAEAVAEALFSGR